MTIESEFRAKRASGRKLLVPYVTGGYRKDWPDIVRAVVAGGADAVEVGIPFSDPVMDGPVIQETTRLALESGATPPAIVHAIGCLDVDVPLVVMTAYNICFRAGHERFAAMLAEAGISGAILPDLPVDELDGWADAADAADLVVNATPLGM
ncbi:MAG: tryptophan synthase subunit alpha, partial [Acidimicrobiia bacterium]